MARGCGFGFSTTYMSEKSSCVPQELTALSTVGELHGVPPCLGFGFTPSDLHPFLELSALSTMGE